MGEATAAGAASLVYLSRFGASFAGLTPTDWRANGDPQHALTACASMIGLKTSGAVDWQPLAFDLTPASQTYGVTAITRSALQEPLPERQAVQSQTLCCGMGP